MSQMNLLEGYPGDSRYYSGALFSPCKRYRYLLWRRWGERNWVNFIMLNPSTADEAKNDPTVERCERRARMWGFGGLLVTNIFAYRATDPDEMKRSIYPVGVENDRYIVRVAWRSSRVICAWGQHGKHMERADQVRALLQNAGIQTFALKVGRNGEPFHPLYVPYAQEAQEYGV